MMIHSPKITVGLPVFNGEDYLAGAIEALLDQTFEDFTLIVLDNASTDATGTIGRAFERRDSRVRYFRNERTIGLAPNFNKVFHLSSSEYFKWAASDDLHAPEFLERCCSILDDDPSVVLAHTGMQAIDENGAWLPFDERERAFIDAGGDFRRPDLSLISDIFSKEVATRFRNILHAGPGHETYGLIRSSALRRTSLLRLEGRLLLNELALMGRIAHVPDPLFFPRLYPIAPVTRRERIELQTGNRPTVMMPPLRTFLEHLAVVYNAEISPLEKAQCAWAVIQYALRPASLRHAFLPGPNNYWGATFLKRTA